MNDHNASLGAVDNPAAAYPLPEIETNINKAEPRLLSAYTATLIQRVFWAMLVVWGVVQLCWQHSPHLFPAAAWFGTLLVVSFGSLVAAWRLTENYPRLSAVQQSFSLLLIYLSLGQGAYMGLPSPKYIWVLPALGALPAIFVAIKRNMQFFAFFGYICAFVSPIILGIFTYEPRLVFGYYLFLCLFLPGITAVTNWRVLNIFALSWLVILCAVFLYTAYSPSVYLYSQLYFLAFFALYVLIVILRQRNPDFSLRNFYDFTLGCSIAVAALFCQLRMAAWSGALTVASLLFFALAFWLLALCGIRTGRERSVVLAQFYFLLVFILLNICVHAVLPPFFALVAFCIEAVVLFYISSIRRYWRCKAVIYIFLALIPFYFLGTANWAGGSFIIAFMYLACAFVQAGERKRQGRRSGRRAWSSWQELLLLVAGFIWWFGGIAFLIFTYLPTPGLAFFAACSAWSCFFYALGKIIRFRALRGIIFLPLIVSIPAAVLPFFYQTYIEWPAVNHFLSYNYLGGIGGLAWVAYFVCVWTALYRNWGGLISNTRHAQFLVLATLELILVLTSSMRALALETGVSPSILSALSVLPSLICIAALSRMIKVRPFYGPYRKAMFVVLPSLLFIALASWFVFALASPGNAAPGGNYIPLLNPVELAQLLCLLVFGYWQRRARKSRIPTAHLSDGKLFWIYGLGIFIWLHGLMFRVVQFFSEAPAFQVLSFVELRFIFALFWLLFGITFWLGSIKFISSFSWLIGLLLVLAGGVGLTLFGLQIKGQGLAVLLLLASSAVLLLLVWFSPAPFTKKAKKMRA